MKFTKMHGCGNDYLYVNCFREQVEQPQEVARKLSERHFGAGSDGLVLICPSERADLRMIMYNADGSRGDMCGNASRCIGKYAYERGLVRSTEMTLETDSGIRSLRLQVEGGRVTCVTVDMGIPETDCARVPCLLGQGVVLEAPVRVEGRTFGVTPVNTGNPHGVIFMEESVEDFPLSHFGPLLETHPAFPRKANIEFVNVLERGKLRMRVWERGSGVTLACGTGACAALCAGVLLGRCDRRAHVQLDGGVLEISWDEESGHVLMSGPAAFVYEGNWPLEE